MTQGSTDVLKVEFEREDDGRWIAEIPTLPGAMTYGISQEEARGQSRGFGSADPC